MPDHPTPERLAEAEAYAARHGLGPVSPAERDALAAMSERVRVQTASLRRMPHKTDEPAHVFRVKGRETRRDRPGGAG